jgi:hypothetical protein
MRDDHGLPSADGDVPGWSIVCGKLRGLSPILVEIGLRPRDALVLIDVDLDADDFDGLADPNACAIDLRLPVSATVMAALKASGRRRVPLRTRRENSKWLLEGLPPYVWSLGLDRNLRSDEWPAQIVTLIKALGRGSPPASVVDSRERVDGWKGIRALLKREGIELSEDTIQRRAKAGKLTVHRDPATGRAFAFLDEIKADFPKLRDR